MRAYITIVLIISALSSRSQEIPIEFFAGNDYSTVDIRFARTLKSSTHFSIFSKNVIYSDWQGSTSVNSIQNLNYSFTEHLGLVSALQFKPSGVAWRNGLRFIDHGENHLRVGQLLYEIGPTNRIAYLIILRQVLPINKKYHWVYQIDLLGGLSDKDLSFLSGHQRVRLGLGKGSSQLGLALNLAENRVLNNSETKNNHLWSTETNLGLFFRQEL